jgi:hypothetical protein
MATSEQRDGGAAIKRPRPDDKEVLVAPAKFYSKPAGFVRG